VYIWFCLKTCYVHLAVQEDAIAYANDFEYEGKNVDVLPGDHPTSNSEKKKHLEREDRSPDPVFLFAEVPHAFNGSQTPFA